MTLISRQDSVRDHKDVQEAEPLTNFAQINPILKKQEEKKVKLVRLRTQRRVTRREVQIVPKNEEKKAETAAPARGSEQSSFTKLTTYRAYFRIDEGEALSVRNPLR